MPFTFFFHKSLKLGVYFTLRTQLNSDVKCSSEIFYLYLNFITFAVDKVDSHTQTVLNIIKISPKTEPKISFKF